MACSPSAHGVFCQALTPGPSSFLGSNWVGMGPGGLGTKGFRTWGLTKMFRIFIYKVVLMDFILIFVQSVQFKQRVQMWQGSLKSSHDK